MEPIMHVYEHLCKHYLFQNWIATFLFVALCICFIVTTLQALSEYIFIPGPQRIRHGPIVLDFTGRSDS